MRCHKVKIISTGGLLLCLALVRPLQTSPLQAGAKLLALVNTQSEMTGLQSELIVSQIGQTDLNHDGYTDSAALLDYRSLQEDNFDRQNERLQKLAYANRWIAIALGGPADSLHLAYLKDLVACHLCGGVYGPPDIEFQVHPHSVSFSAHGGSNWRWANSREIAWQGDHFVLASLGLLNYHVTADIEMDTTIDFRHRLARRDERQLGLLFSNQRQGNPGGPWPSEAEWEAVPRDRFDQAQWLIHGARQWQGPADSSLELASVWDSGGLYLRIRVRDDVLVRCEKTTLACDHIEIWLWPRGYYSIFDEYDQEQRSSRQTKPTAGPELQTGLLQWGALVNPERTSVLHDLLNQYKAIPQSRSLITWRKDGFQMDVFLPAQTLQSGLRQADQSWQAFRMMGLSVVYSDTDSVTRPAQDTLIGSSQLQWGRAASLGIVHLWPGSYRLPDPDFNLFAPLAGD
ncbi:MAG: hypothetical protein KDK39_01215 [Leptospiraceae bacterium]|nr:hypothetical protein [Leptospiraceae bacterium]